MDSALLYNAMGFAAIGLFLWAYAMINLGYWNEKQVRFHIPNLLGALLMMGSLLGNWNLPIFVLEVFWSAISLYGIWRGVKQRCF
jgi:hypothetical protein